MIASRRQFIVRSGLAALLTPLVSRLALAESTPAHLDTTNGTIVGEETAGVRVFRGIPYAAAPVGILRFRAPEPVAPWKGVRDATRFAASAMQTGEAGVEHSEDCLALNIWAPAKPGPHPVFVWIHGGGFTNGHAFEPVYDGTALAEAGIVAVTVGYRLGVLGFLDLGPLLGPSYSGSANNALRDLIASLRWIHENIAAAGGDPERVTIGGESAGAKLTGLLMGIPAARPLFQQMISESGGAERIWSSEQSAAVARGFGELWQRQTGLEPAKLVTAPAAQLIDVQRLFMQSWPQHFPLRAELDGKLLPRRPIEAIAAGNTHGKRLLIGTNLDESALFIGPHPQRDPGPGDLGNLAVERFNEVFARYAKLYPHLNTEQLRIRALTAEEYWIPSLRVAEAHTAGGGSAHVYRLDFAEASGRMSGLAYHSLDVRLVWNHPDAHISNADAEAALARQMQQAWIHFIQTGKPAAEGLPDWPQWQTGTRQTMLLNTTSRVEEQPQRAEAALWQGVL